MKKGIEQKITALFILGILLYAVSLGVAFYSIKSILDTMSRMDHISEQIQITGDLQLYLYKINDPTHDYLLTGDIRERDVFDEVMIQISGNFEKLKRVEGVKRWREVLKKATDDAVKLGDKGIDLLYTDNPVGNRHAAVKMKELDAFAEKLIDEVGVLHEISQENIRAQEDLAKEKSRVMVASFAVLLLVSIVSMPFLLFYLRRRVVRPILTLYDGVNMIGQGKLEQRLTVKTGDELEVLADGFNAMAGSLEETKRALDSKILELYALYNVSKILNGSLETEWLVKKLVEMVSKNLDISRVMVMLREEEKEEIYAASFAGFGEEGISEVRRKLGEGFFGHIASNGIARLVQNIDEEHGFPVEDRLSPSINSIIAVPFKKGDKTMGVLCAFKDKPNVFKDHDMDLFVAVAEQVAIALENARLYRETRMLAIRDGLTGLYNRGFFNGKIEAELKRAKRYQREMSLIMMDLDHFKNYNDRHGHQAGDHLLKGLAGVLQNETRDSDVICRYGGEEFIVILPESSKTAAVSVAERIRKSVEGYPFPFRETQPLKAVTLSLGVANFPADSNDVEELVKKADDALYQAKKSGRNCTVAASIHQLSYDSER